MNPKYPRAAWSLRRRIALAMMTFMGIVIGAVGLIVYIDMQQNGSASVQGASQTIMQTAAAQNSKLMVSEPLFEMQLPGDWKEAKRTNLPTEHSITWQGTTKYEDNRSITLYVDVIPPNLAVNKILPVTVQGVQLSPQDMSDNCVDFTSGGSRQVQKAVQARDTSAKWMGVDFICDMDNVVDNQIGVGSTAGLNQIVVTTPKGTHKYFFVYADRNIHPDATILKDALNSFKAK
jgi:hypothetical protein